jgi:hypothetical protein
MTTSNVLAETNLGDGNYTIVVGSHLDSVPAGKGINDNGTATGVSWHNVLSRLLLLVFACFFFICLFFIYLFIESIMFCFGFSSV